MASDHSTVALVHGCTQGPSGWDLVRDLLSGSGVRSVAVDLDPRDFDGTTAPAGAVAARLGRTPIDLPTGHCPQNSRPEAVADNLTGIASPQG